MASLAPCTWPPFLPRNFFQRKKHFPFFHSSLPGSPKHFDCSPQGVWTPEKAPRSSRRPRDLREQQWPVKCKRLRLYRCGQRPMGLRPMVTVEILSRKLPWRVRTYNVLQVKVLLYEWNLLLESWARDESQKDVLVFILLWLLFFICNKPSQQSTWPKTRHNFSTPAAVQLRNFGWGF